VARSNCLRERYEAGVRPSVGSVGDAYDDAMYESFFATLDFEPLDRCRFPTPVVARPGDLRLHRGLVQAAPTALGPRLPVAHGV
jgi:putative transposase